MTVTHLSAAAAPASLTMQCSCLRGQAPLQRTHGYKQQGAKSGGQSVFKCAVWWDMTSFPPSAPKAVVRSFANMLREHMLLPSGTEFFHLSTSSLSLSEGEGLSAKGLGRSMELWGQNQGDREDPAVCLSRPTTRASAWAFPESHFQTCAPGVSRKQSGPCGQTGVSRERP